MSSPNDSFTKTIVVAVGLCLGCSLLVSLAAVGLKSDQNANKVADIRRSILEASGLLEDPTANINEIFDNRVEAVVVDFATGSIANDIDPASFDQRKASKDPALNKELTKDEDLASIKRRAKYGKAYLVKSQGNVESIILPVHGYGLYSTLYGFLALKADTQTVIGLKFYEQGETPGLGGEVVNPRWIAQWPGKKVLDDNHQPALKLVKTGANNDYEVDALTGASMTSRGVENLLAYWLGDDGFGPYLANFRAEQSGGSHGI